MTQPQPGILAPVPSVSRYLTFGLRPAEDPRPSLEALGKLAIDERAIFGIGASVAGALQKKIEGLRTFPEHAGVGCIARRHRTSPRRLRITLRDPSARGSSSPMKDPG
jgi:hypothetical protein